MSDLGRMRTATRHSKRSSSQTAAQREEGLTTERLWNIPFFISSSYYTCTFPYTSSAYWTYVHTFRVFLLYYYSSFKFIYCCMVEVRGMCLRGGGGSCGDSSSSCTTTALQDLPLTNSFQGCLVPCPLPRAPQHQYPLSYQVTAGVDAAEVPRMASISS